MSNFAEPATVDSPASGNLPDASREELERAWQTTWQFLINEQCADGSHWDGQLSTSALSTATAISALVMAKRGMVEKHGAEPASGQFQIEDIDTAIIRGCEWIQEHQNPDGGFGDTIRSHSNIATTLLCIAAWELAEYSAAKETPSSAAWEYVDSKGRWDGLRRRYGKDKTFVVPILSNCALAGLVSWKKVPTLPFEAAWLPQSWYRFARMPVVSYAVPALVAIGQAKFHFAPTLNPLTRLVRNYAKKPTLRVLRSMQPESGGYLEAVPLTSFVLMSLAAVGNSRLKVAQECLRFIMESRLEDGSWPIDTNLATWVTSLTTVAYSKSSGNICIPEKNRNAAGATAANDTTISVPTKLVGIESEYAKTDTSTDGGISARTLRWLLSCQHITKHPFTGANPGGWGWTDLSGAVPDADDTPSALIALAKFQLDDSTAPRLKHQTFVAAGQGLGWLLRLQNRDGGWPTFCRGWGKLPFDRSGTDLTAHAIRAFRVWLPRLDELARCGKQVPTREELLHAERRGFAYLRKMQRENGSWLPLWFGNQDDSEEENPFYGTGKVLLAYADCDKKRVDECLAGLDFLRNHQNPDGGWGGGESTGYRNPRNNAELPPEIGSTIEETAVVLEALIQCGGDPLGDATIMRGLTWLVGTIEDGRLDCAWPIGFYFAKLWYYERLYPAIFSLGALGSALRRIASDETELAR